MRPKIPIVKVLTIILLMITIVSSGVFLPTNSASGGLYHATRVVNGGILHGKKTQKKVGGGVDYDL